MSEGKMIPASEVVADLNDISDMVSGEIYETVIAVRDKYAPPPAIDWDAARFGDEVETTDGFTARFLTLDINKKLIWVLPKPSFTPPQSWLRTDIKSITRPKYTEPNWHDLGEVLPEWVSAHAKVMVKKGSKTYFAGVGEYASNSEEEYTHFAVIKGGV